MEGSFWKRKGRKVGSPLLVMACWCKSFTVFFPVKTFQVSANVESLNCNSIRGFPRKTQNMAPSVQQLRQKPHNAAWPYQRFAAAAQLIPIQIKDGIDLIMVQCRANPSNTLKETSTYRSLVIGSRSLVIFHAQVVLLQKKSQKLSTVQDYALLEISASSKRGSEKRYILS